MGRIRTVVEVWADRTLELGALDGVEQVFPFENRGEEIGVTLHHPHGQIYAYPFVAPRTARQLDVARAHRDATGECRSCSIVAAEAEGERVVATAPGWLAFVPFAARWPFEVHLFPTRHLPDLPALDDDERDGLAALLKDVLGRFDALFDQPLPYMLTCHQAPVRRDRDLAHAHLEAFSIRRSATSSSTWPPASRGRACSSTTSPPSRRPSCCAPRCRRPLNQDYPPTRVVASVTGSFTDQTRSTPEQHRNGQGRPPKELVP